MMKSKPITDQKIIASQSLIQLIRKSILIYIIVAVALLIFCITLGWRTLENWIYLWFFMSNAIWHFNFVWKYSAGSTIRTLTPKV